MVAARECAFQDSEQGADQKDVKNEGTSGDVYENKASTTKCHAKNAGFCKKNHQSHVI
jgi:hypothetical protein